MQLYHFYLSVPNADGIFIGSKASEDFEEGVSLYGFERSKDNPDSASFWLAKEAIEFALENIAKRIEPVCDSENHPDKNARYIETIKPGAARLLPNGNWKMETKAEIKYLEANEQERQRKLQEAEELKKQKEEEAKTREAETKVKEAEAKLKEAEAKIKEAEAKAIEVEIKLKEAEAKAKDEAAKKAIEEAIKKTRAEADAKIAEEKRKAEVAAKILYQQNNKQRSSKSGCGKKIGYVAVCAVIIFTLLAIIGILVEKDELSNSTQAEAPKVGTLVDNRNSKTYKTIKIGSQIWMAENLNYKVGKSTCYENDESKCKECGRLYDWVTASKACPNGWHLPSRAEWAALDLGNVVGGSSKVGSVLKARSGWSNNGNGTDEYDFSALPCGRHYNDGFKHHGSLAQFWTATEGDASNNKQNTGNYAWGIGFDANNENMDMGNLNKAYLRSVRCIQD